MQPKTRAVCVVLFWLPLVPCLLFGLLGFINTGFKERDGGPAVPVLFAAFVWVVAWYVIWKVDRINSESKVRELVIYRSVMEEIDNGFFDKGLLARVQVEHGLRMEERELRLVYVRERVACLMAQPKQANQLSKLDPGQSA